MKMKMKILSTEKSQKQKHRNIGHEEFWRPPLGFSTETQKKNKAKIKEEEENFGYSSVESNGAEVERKMKTSEGLFRKPNWPSWMLKKTHKRKIKDERL